MINLKAYCLLCGINVTGKLLEIIRLESGKHLFRGECPVCFYEIKRIMPENLKDILDNGS